jgi:sterol desaturase/sphingolipid hydroxylase (fatty acid hydroxylase superfamily)
MNYAISLSLWDYIFKTNYIPEDSGNVKIGFKDDDKFPSHFINQNLYGFKKGQK